MIGLSFLLFLLETDWFHKEPLELDLVFACIGDMNTTIRGGQAWPIIYGVGKNLADKYHCSTIKHSKSQSGFNAKTGEIFHATFPDKGPDLALRSARQLTGSSHVRVVPLLITVTLVVFIQHFFFIVNGHVRLFFGFATCRAVSLPAASWCGFMARPGK